MPRRALLSQAQRDALFALPATEGEWLRYYTLTDSDLAVIAQRRGGHNRQGRAVSLLKIRIDPYPPSAKATLSRTHVRALPRCRIDPYAW